MKEPNQDILPGEPLWFPKYRLIERHIGTILTIALVPLNWTLACMLAASFMMRMWGAEVVYHRYFAHRSYRLGRISQFIFALIGAQSGQRGPLWWASTHRAHHQYVETGRDPHTPVGNSFWHAHAKWTLVPGNFPTDLKRIPDLAKYPELVLLNKYAWVPVYGLGALLFAGGAAGLFGSDVSGFAALGWGFLVPSLLAAHATGFVNSIGHMPQVPGGYRRFGRADRSTNRPLLALFTMGAGWHNNHHQYPVPARAGFAWYEIDLGWYSLKILAALGIVKDLKETLPEEVRRAGRLGEFRRGQPAITLTSSGPPP